MKLDSIHIQGYRPFGSFTAALGPLEVLVGANGSGKSSLFEFLRFLRDSVQEEIPPEIVESTIGQQIFHRPGPDRFLWKLSVASGERTLISYEGVLDGPVGRVQVSSERVIWTPKFSSETAVLMEVQKGSGSFRTPYHYQEIALRRFNQLALGIATNPVFETLYVLREYIGNWRFYSSFNISQEKIRQPVPIEQEPVLREDAGNLSSVLHFLYTEHPLLFDELQQHLRSLVPGFQGLSVKARGGPGQVIAFWREQGVEGDLSLADLSDGTLRLLCWIALCLHPNPPSLICVDEPDQGVHPRTLPLLAGLFEKASGRTQILLATHASYFLLQFDLQRIAVLRREDGEAKFFKPADSAALKSNLEDFGAEEIEVMHRSDELERLA